MQLPSTLSGLSPENRQENAFLIFREMELSSRKIENLLIFSYISGNGTFLKKFLYCGKWNLLQSFAKNIEMIAQVKKKL